MPSARPKQALTLEESFEKLNRYLFHWFFGDDLHRTIIVLNRKMGSSSYSAMRPSWHEIVLNPDVVRELTDAEILVLLTHEMCHCWQRQKGASGRANYHDDKWATTMEELGLKPSSTGAPGGRRVGQEMSQYPIVGGRFQEVIADFFSHCKIDRREFATPAPKVRPTKNKTKFKCRTCSLVAWAKPSAQLACGVCHLKLEAVIAESVAEVFRANSASI